MCRSGQCKPYYLGIRTLQEEIATGIEMKPETAKTGLLQLELSTPGTPKP